MKFRKDLLISSGLYINEENAERHANWTELLFDLIFVAAVSQIALNLSYSYDFQSFIMLMPIFFVIWWGWVGHTFYLSRFGTDDLYNRFLTMLQMIVVAFLTIYAKNALDTTGFGFAISYAVLRFILVVEYLVVGRNVPGAKSLSNHYSIGFSIAALIWLISAFTPTPWRFVLWGVAIIIDILTPLTARNLQLKLPPHPTHLPERFGLFTIILIGEAIVSIVFAISNAGPNPYTEIVGLFGLIIAFTIWWGYFEEAKGAEGRVQESEEDVKNYQLWLYSHFPLLLGIVGVAAGIKNLILLKSPLPLPYDEVWLLCISLGIALLSLSGIFLSAFDWKTCLSKVLLKFRAPYYLIILLVISTGFLGTLFAGWVILALLTLLCIFKIIFSLREIPDQVCKI
ncbi:MAG: low temperature requirement protein A [Methanobacterium sp.]|nr:low temperature requirement protein A [Methanobacterium sp.]